MRKHHPKHNNVRCARGGLDQTCDAWCGSGSGYRCLERFDLTCLSQSARLRASIAIPSGLMDPSWANVPDNNARGRGSVGLYPCDRGWVLT
jgi:hypothetical protein